MACLLFYNFLWTNINQGKCTIQTFNFYVVSGWMPFVYILLIHMIYWIILLIGLCSTAKCHLGSTISKKASGKSLRCTLFGLHGCIATFCLPTFFCIWVRFSDGNSKKSRFFRDFRVTALKQAIWLTDCSDQWSLRTITLSYALETMYNLQKAITYKRVHLWRVGGNWSARWKPRQSRGECTES